eukprot:c3452_g1_i1.p1 GENE.c3452_g1_i1~~c3452_g1_i1.p1  ORF type:complete len:181 (+),score=30.88 c3452_g1_i1:61-603(+)
MSALIKRKFSVLVHGKWGMWTLPDYVVQVTPSMTILRVKQLLADVSGVPAHDLQLKFRGKRLNDSKRLFNYWILSSCELHMVRTSPLPKPIVEQPRQISVSCKWGMWSLPDYTLEASPDMTVLDLKSMIAERSGIPVVEQQLSFSGSLLQDWQLLHTQQTQFVMQRQPIAVNHIMITASR